ncbi:MAG: hypothetical protein AB9856_01450 [Cellulosilyticaceae bacterium]
MMDNNLNELKQKYSEGYRCIYKEKTPKEGCTMHLKNFTSEKIHTVHSNDTMEIGEMEGYLDTLEVAKKLYGHDCHNTEINL